MATAFKAFIEQYGYFAIFLIIMFEDFGVPVPGETALVVAAAAAAEGKLDVRLVMLVAVCGAIIGDNIGFAIGHVGGRPLVARVGPKVGITQERFAKAESFFTRYGDGIVVGARFVDVLRQLNGIIAGVLGMHWAKFLAWNALGAVLWVSAWTAVGYLAGQHMTAIAHWVTRFSWLLLLLAGVAAIVFVVWRRSHPPASP